MRTLPAVAFLLLSPVLCAAQSVTTQLEPRQVALGAFNQSFHRRVEYSNGPVSVDWNRLALFAAFRPSRLITVQLDGLAWHRGSTNRFPSRDYVDLSAGAGLQLQWQRGAFAPGVSVHYHQLVQLDQSPERYSKRSWRLLVAAPIRYQSRVLTERIDIWAGPVFAYDEVVQLPPGDLNATGTSIDNFGAVVGGAVLLRRRVSIQGQAVYANYWHGYAGLSVIL